MNSRFGYRIRNYDAAVLFEVNLGVRDELRWTNAVFPTSLLNDYLTKNGLTINKDNSTHDIICVRFNYGSTSYEKQLKKLNKKIKNAQNQDDIKYFEQLIEKAHQDKDKFEEHSIAELRDIFYTQGISIQHKDKTIRYRFLFRSTGKSKVGEAIFINEKLYDLAADFIHMSLELPEENAPIVELQAYSALIASSIVDRIQIRPEEILVLKDVDSFIKTDVISIEVDDEKHCIAKEVKDYMLKNTLFDGQALIDASIFPFEWAEGYILLRHHFFKAAAFAANIQLFFQDYFGDAYDTAKLTDMWGNKHLAKDIKMITTDNSLKFLKFDVSFDYWARKIVAANDSVFGIVKTAHRSKFGDVQRMSYQMINALDLKSMDDVISTSKDYIYQLKTNDEVFLQFLRDNQNFANEYDVLIALYERNPKIAQSDYFRQRRYEIIRCYIMDFKNGRVLQNADNLVIVGNPYAELLHAVGEDPLSDPTFSKEDGTIQVFTERFEDGKHLASFRSPFNSQNNLCYLHNHYHPLLERYFYIGKQCIAVNMIETDFQARNNGSDQDSDSIYTTDHHEIVSWAAKCISLFPTIDNNIPKDTNHYNNTMEDCARVDTKLASASTAIGESSNLAQLALTYSFNFDDPKYQKYTCILAVLAQVAIDNAKRAYDIDLVSEIKRIKADLNIEENGLPLFWFYIKRKGKFAQAQREKRRNKEGLNPNLICPMNYLVETKFERTRSLLPTIPLTDLIVRQKLENKAKRPSKKVEHFIEKYSAGHKALLSAGTEEAFVLLEMNFEELVRDLNRLYISKNYVGLMNWLLLRAFNGRGGHNKYTQSSLYKNRPALLKTLYKINPALFLECFKTPETEDAKP